MGGLTPTTYFGSRALSDSESGGIKDVQDAQRRSIEDQIKSARKPIATLDDSLDRLYTQSGEFAPLGGNLLTNPFDQKVYNDQNLDVTELYQKWQKTKGQIQASNVAHEEYVKKKNEAPGRDATILVAPEAKSLLGG